MGLDMYLRGEKYVLDHSNPENNDTEDGFPVRSKTYAIAQWRKHPDLHGFIVENFADDDDCQPVQLSTDAITEIIAAISEGRLPKTTGFFFGESVNDASRKEEDIRVFTRALEWLKVDDWERSIFYQASW